jgi:signal peptidase I
LASVADAALTAIGLSPGDGNDHLIKRVIGLPGDTVTCCNPFGQLTINDIPLNEPYIQLPVAQTPATKSPFAVIVPDGMIWVMGDNRYNSADSAFHYLKGDPGGGFVPINKVVGRAFVVSWPAQHWARLGSYSATFAEIDR